jgi:hypothetical protein
VGPDGELFLLRMVIDVDPVTVSLPHRWCKH